MDRRDREALDDHITGHGGEDSIAADDGEDYGLDVPPDLDDVDANPPYPTTEEDIREALAEAGITLPAEVAANLLPRRNA